MIHDSSKRILLDSHGVSTASFDIDTLHDQISLSFRENGIDNKWMADDILIALQNYMLANSFQVKSDEDLDQVHATVVKVLQDNGFPEVADHFSRHMQDSSVSFLNSKIVSEFKKLGTDFSGADCANVLNKILNLGYQASSISHLLIREICRLESSQSLTSNGTFEKASPGEILPFGEKYVNWNWGYLQMRAAGALFHSIRIDIFPLTMAMHLEMPVFMEILFMDKWEKVIHKASSYLENCLCHLRDVDNLQISYISIVIHDVQKLLDFYQLGKGAPLLAEINDSLKSTFGKITRNFAGLKLISTEK